MASKASSLVEAGLTGADLTGCRIYGVRVAKPTMASLFDIKRSRLVRAPGAGLRIAPGGSLATNGSPPIRWAVLRILSGLARDCVVQATGRNYSLIASRRTGWRRFLVLWSANDRQGAANGWDRHSPTSYRGGPVAMPRRGGSRQAEWWPLGRAFPGDSWWLVVGLGLV